MDSRGFGTVYLRGQSRWQGGWDGLPERVE